MTSMPVVHFAHPGHGLKLREHILPHTCDLCNGIFFGSGYSCHRRSCGFHLHEECAKYPETLRSFFAHPWHDLTLGRNDGARPCDLCREEVPAGVFTYRCKPCGFDMHPRCSRLPQTVRSDLHPDHAMTAAPGCGTCAACRKPCDVWHYRCGLCNVDLHIACLHGGSSDAGSSAGGSDGAGERGSKKESTSLGDVVGKAFVEAGVEALTTMFVSYAVVVVADGVIDEQYREQEPEAPYREDERPEDLGKADGGIDEQYRKQEHEGLYHEDERPEDLGNDGGIDEQYREQEPEGPCREDERPEDVGKDRGIDEQYRKQEPEGPYSKDERPEDVGKVDGGIDEQYREQEPEGLYREDERPEDIGKDEGIDEQYREQELKGPYREDERPKDVGKDGGIDEQYREQEHEGPYREHERPEDVDKDGGIDEQYREQEPEGPYREDERPEDVGKEEDAGEDFE